MLLKFWLFSPQSIEYVGRQQGFSCLKFYIQGHNPRYTAGWIDEDCMGLIKKYARRSSAKKFSLGILKLSGYRLLALRYRIVRLNAQSKSRNQWNGKRIVVMPRVHGDLGTTNFMAINNQNHDQGLLCYKKFGRRNSTFTWFFGNCSF